MVAIDIAKQRITDATALRIRQLRVEQKLSQEELALRAGLSPAYLGHIERGLKCPTIDTINKIANALGISLAVFFDFSTPFTDHKCTLKRIENSMQKISEQDASDLATIIEEFTNIIKRKK